MRTVREDEAEPRDRRFIYQKPKSNALLYLAVVAGAVTVIVIAAVLLGGGLGETTIDSEKFVEEYRQRIEYLIPHVQEALKTATRNMIGAEQKLQELKSLIDEASPYFSAQETSIYRRRYQDLEDELNGIKQKALARQELDVNLSEVVTELSNTTELEKLKEIAEKTDVLVERARKVFEPAEVERFQSTWRSAWLRVCEAYREEAESLIRTAGTETKAQLDAHDKAIKLLEGIKPTFAKKFGEDSEDAAQIGDWISEYERRKRELEARKEYEELEAMVNALCAENKFLDALEAIDRFPAHFMTPELKAKVEQLAEATKQKRYEHAAQQQRPPDSPPGPDAEGFDVIVQNGRVMQTGVLQKAGPVDINWHTVDDTLVGKHPGTKLNPPTPRDHKFDALLTLGDDTWKNYEVILEINVIEVGTILSVRADFSRSTLGKPIWLVPPRITLNTWNTIRILVQGDSLTLTMNERTFPSEAGLNAISPNGRILLALYPGTEVRIRNLRLKRLPD